MTLSNSIIGTYDKEMDNCKMNADNELLKNLNKLHTTELGVERIKRNLSLDTDDVVDWCKTKINSDNAVITRNGKNWYVNVDNYILTVNAYSYTIITAHKEKKLKKNPWEEISLSDYENHMKLDSVMQLQAMNEMMKDQFDI